MNVYSHVTQDQRLTATRAIVLYEDKTTALATVHQIVEDGDKTPVLLPGRLLTRETLGEMVRKMSGLPQSRTLLPEGVLCYDSGRLVWWVPACRRPIFFKTREAKFDTALSGKMVQHPALVFMAEASRLHIFALQENKRPVAETALCQAPYFNIYSGGAMCSGNVKLPEKALPSEIPIWEKAFYETNFTHTNAGKLTSYPGGHDALWKAMAEESVQAFPGEYLLPINLTLEGLVNK